MNRKTSFIALALVAMFACSTPAQAQWGGLLNKARKAAGIKTKQEKAQDAAQQRRDSVLKAAAAITPTIPQAAESGQPITIKWGDTPSAHGTPLNSRLLLIRLTMRASLPARRLSTSSTQPQVSLPA